MCRARRVDRAMSAFLASLFFVSTESLEQPPAERVKRRQLIIGWVRRRWALLTIVSAAMVVAFIVGFGIAAGWGSSQWGPLSAWVASALTLSAVSIALWQAFRSQHIRLVDHEIARRRECLKALADLWSAIGKMVIRFAEHTGYYDDLPREFDIRANSPDGTPYATEIAQKCTELIQLWTDTIEPPLFYVLALTRSTPLDDEMRKLSSDLHRVLTTDVRALSEIAMTESRRPDTDHVNAKWHEIVVRRERHLSLAREHFSLKLNEVEQSLSRKG